MSQPFGNSTAVTVAMGQRVIARLILGALGVAVYLVYTIGVASAMANSSAGLLLGLSVVMLVCAVGLTVWQLVLMLKDSTTVGGKLLKFRFLNADTGEDAKAQLLLKYLVQGVFESVTVGLGAISYLVTYRDGQHWLDRAFKMVAVRNDSVQGAGHLAGRQLEPQKAQPRVMPVQMPQKQGRFDVSPSAAAFDPTGPAAPQQPPAGSASFPSATQTIPPAPEQASVPAPGVQPAAPDPVLSPQPHAPANPWAMPAEPAPLGEREAESGPIYAAPPPLPSYASFAPTGQPLIPPSPGAQFGANHGGGTHQAPPALLLSDETVVDPSVAAEAAPVVLLDDGQRIVLDAPVVLGRNPSSPSSYPLARCVQVADESMRLSKTHLVLVPGEEGVGVFDVGATNGVHIERDGLKARIPTGEVYPLTDDAVLHFGGRSLQVLR